MRPGQESIDIRRLISPLRYDVIVRARFLIELRNLHAEPMAALQEFALEDPYFTWFKQVESARFFPTSLDDRELLLQRFQLRVARAITTLRSYERLGFDARHPVTLGKTSGGAVTDLGTVLSKSLHIRDGCHRLALLWMNDQPLEPAMYRVHSFRGPALDNTALLLQHMNIDDDEYARFLSHAFAGEEYSELSELRRSVAEVSPDRLAEFDEIVRVHGRARRTAG
ncbi:MAG: hypothetical protein WKF82_13270 [Nocardioidaceae bacterium]